MPQFDVAFFPSQIFWLIVSFIFLYLMTSHLILPMLHDIFQERDDAIQHHLDRAERLNKQAESLMMAYDAFLSAAEDEKTRLLQTTHDDIQRRLAMEEDKTDRAIRRRFSNFKQKMTTANRAIQKESNRAASQISEDLIRKFYTPQQGGNS